ncbi:hypothetical protein CROQUDRAFT_93946 [Cronartium quercuum f. sp. fusiforme G11]|uniref:Uncharacterized protein n=1 Tax=Cronartium quercuum f. sp. fusiforme G11 TaxID=708437 RepID=A0A9P6NJT4_9BASI|nr:hypothetical protein CROQUDRAFT_93946 [Cronartium quercuum f. sp. fusiforme G11]
MRELSQIRQRDVEKNTLPIFPLYHNRYEPFRKLQKQRRHLPNPNTLCRRRVTPAFGHNRTEPGPIRQILFTGKPSELKRFLVDIRDPMRSVPSCFTSEAWRII